MYRYFLLVMALLWLPPVFARPETSYPSAVLAGRPAGNDDQHSVRNESTGALTLARALELAMHGNAELAAARLEIEAVDATLRQAGIRPNPEISVLVEDTRRQTKESTLQISQLIELGGKRAARIALAISTQDVARAELDVKTADLQASVITAFFDVLGAQERLDLTIMSAKLAQRFSDVTTRRVAAGKVSPVEATRARVAASSVQIELNQVQAELANARKRLAATWGNPVPRFEQAQGDFSNLPVLPSAARLAQLLTQAPELGRARTEVERRHALAEVEQRRRQQDFTISLGAKKLGPENGARTQAVIGVSMPLPLFDRNQGNIAEATYRSEKARLELMATETRLDNELTQAVHRFDSARANAALLQHEIVPGAQSAFDATTKGYEFGKFGFLDVLDARRALLQAHFQYLASLAETHKAAADIDRLIGNAVLSLAISAETRP